MAPRKDDPDFRSEIPAFVARIKRISETWELKAYLEVARETEPFDPRVYAEQGAEVVATERQADLRNCFVAGRARKGMVARRMRG